MLTAKSSYQQGNLQDAHFALQQAMQELDIALGKEILKLFPASIDSLTSTDREGQVSGSHQLAGVTVLRNYGTAKQANLTVVINSPLLQTLNAFIASPLMAGFSDPNQKVVKVAGYKGRLIKDNEATNSYKLELPLNNALLTLELPQVSESYILEQANKLPINKIANLLQ